MESQRRFVTIQYEEYPKREDNEVCCAIRNSIDI